MVAVYLPQYRDELTTIGKVVSCDEKSAVVEWYVGSYSGVWRVCKKCSGSSKVLWRETIPKESILFPINFTKSLRLSKSCVDKLKQAYQNKL